MAKTKITKRALLMSALALLMCVSMLIGSTFAWFTDSVTSAGNTIQSGTLDVDLVDANDNSMAGQVIKFVTADNRDQDAILWEPGCTYKTEPVYVVNKGNLALKYEIVINGINGNAKLLEAIEWTVTVGTTTTALADLKGDLLAGAKSEAIVLSGHMKEEAGNEYQGLTADGISIVVYATQLTYETDSFNDQYDAAAEYAAETMLKEVAAGKSNVKLAGDGYVVIDNANPVGAKVTGDVTLDLNGKTLFVKVEDGDEHKSLFNITKGGKLTVTGNGTIYMVSGSNKLVTAIFNNTAGELVIQNGTFKMDYPNNWEVSLIPTIIDNNSSAGAAVTTINGGDFYHTRNMFRNFVGSKAEIIINGGTFNGEADDFASIWNQKPSSSVAEGNGVVTVNGGIFNYVEINNEFTTGVTIADSVKMPVSVSNAAKLKTALAKGGNIFLTADIDMDIADTGFEVPKNVAATLNLNGHDITATGTSDQSVQVFTVAGNLEIVGNGTVSLENKNFPWSDSYRYTAINIRETGVVTLGEGVTVSCVAGGNTAKGNAMTYAVDIYTTGTLNVNGANLHSNYIAVRCFFGNAVVNVNGGSITSSKNNWGIWPQSAPGAVINIASGISYTTDSYGIYIFN